MAGADEVPAVNSHKQKIHKILFNILDELCVSLSK